LTQADFKDHRANEVWWNRPITDREAYRSWQV
jgi:hypothetical protein